MLSTMYKLHLQTLIFPTLNQYFRTKKFSISTLDSSAFRIKKFSISTLDSSAFRTSFLENQCGLSGKSLIRASNLLTFEPSDDRPISVLSLFQTFGFPQPNITKIISSHPDTLQFHSQKIIKPKLDFLVSITHSQTDVVRMVTTDPTILRSSLNNQLIPAFNLLQSVTGSYQNAAAVIKCRPNLLSRSIPNCVLPNINFLLSLGVPRFQIVKLTTCYGTVLGKKHEEFCKIVMKIKEVGFDLSSSYFISAVHTMSFNTDSSWKSRCELFTSFGFSDDEILSVFKRRPNVMRYSPKKTNDIMEFFLNKLGWSPSRLSSKPDVLTYSLEKRIIPRCSVLQVLESKNINCGSFSLTTILAMSERRFLKHFVTAYKDDIPEVVDAHQVFLQMKNLCINSSRESEVVLFSEVSSSLNCIGLSVTSVLQNLVSWIT